MNYHSKKLNFAGAVKGLRSELGLSQKAFAEKCGLVRNTISSIEKGESPHCESLMKIIDGLKIGPDDFMQRALSGFSMKRAMEGSENYRVRSIPEGKKLETFSVLVDPERMEKDLLQSDGSLLMLSMKDDSMEKSIRVGDLLFVKLDQSFNSDGFYLIERSGKMTVRRIHELPSGGFEIFAENSLYLREKVDSIPNHLIVGRILYSGRRL